MSNPTATATVRHLNGLAGPFTVTEAGFGSEVCASFFDRHNDPTAQHAVVSLHHVASVEQGLTVTMPDGGVSTGINVTLVDGRTIAINFFKDAE